MDRRTLLTLGAAAGTVVSLARPMRAEATPASRGPVTTRDGARLFVRDWGEGAPVLFMAGWCLTSDMWAYQAAPLNDAGLRTIAYDRRGHGQSDDPGRGYDFDTLADDLDAVIEQRGLRDVSLVAHSMAGGEATRYLARHGRKGRVKRVLFLAPAMPCLRQKADNPDGFPAAAFEASRRAMQRDFPGWLDAQGEGFVTPQTSPGMKDWIERMMLQTSMRALIDCNRALTEADFRAELRTLKLPCLVIHGDKDLSAPLDFTGRRVAALVPGAELKVYEGAPHGLFVTHIDRLNADIEAFSKA
jgi:non-heme chloroperoxidase